MQSEKDALIEDYAVAAFNHKDAQLPMYIWRQHFVEFADKLAALSAAEPVAELQSIDARELDEAIQLLPSVMRPSLSKVIIAAIEEQRRIIAYFKRISRARQLAFEAATTPPAPSVAVKALEWIVQHPEESNASVWDVAKNALSAQVQDAPEKAGRFGHHPEPAIDFCIEVEALEGHLFDAKHGIGKTGHEPRRIDDEFRRRVSSAMDFIVGGDQIAIAAKATLRSISAQVQDVAGWPPFEFDRYINGKLMAEGVRIERIDSLEDAMIVAARIASRGPNGEVPVLVLRSEFSARRSNAASIRAQAVEDVLSALTAHELYQYRPKAFQGFIDYARSELIPAAPAKQEGGE